MYESYDAGQRFCWKTMTDMYALSMRTTTAARMWMTVATTSVQHVTPTHASAPKSSDVRPSVAAAARFTQPCVCADAASGKPHDPPDDTKALLYRSSHREKPSKIRATISIARK